MTQADRPELAERVSAEIRATMARQRVTQTVLAERIGRSQDYVSRRLTGARSLTLEDLESIAEALGMAVSDFLPELAERSRQ